MPTDEKEIKRAIDSFEGDDFITAKEALKGQIVQAKNDYLKKKLGLEKDPIAVATPQVKKVDPTPAPAKKGKK